MTQVFSFLVTAMGTNHSRREFLDGEPVPFTPKGQPKKYDDRRPTRYKRYGYNDIIRCTQAQAASPAMSHLKLVLWLGGATTTVAAPAPAMPVPAAASSPVLDPKEGQEDYIELPVPAPKPEKVQAKAPKPVGVRVPDDWKSLHISKIRKLAGQISGRPTGKINKEEGIAIVSAHYAMQAKGNKS